MTIIIGAGGHGKVALDILLELGVQDIAFVDDSPSMKGALVLGFPVLGPTHVWTEHPVDALVAGIGSNRVRQQLLELYPDAPWKTIIHPRAVVSRFAQIGAGSMVCMGACIQPSVSLGRLCIANTSCSIDHDCSVDDFAHISVGAHLGGTVTIGEGAFVGLGASILPGMKVGAWSTVGAGGVVAREVPPGVTVKGVPAR